MRLAVCIPTLREEKYIGKLLGDLVKQKYSDFEVIIVDGKSEDGTLKVINSFLGKLKIKVFATSTRSAAHQRNMAVKQTKAENFLFLDADDRISDDFLIKVMEKFEKKHFKVATAFIKPDSSKLSDRIIFWFINWVILWMRQFVSPGGVGAFIFTTREAYAQIGGFDERYRIAEDFQFFSIAHKLHLKYYLFRMPIAFSVRRLDREGRLRWVLKMLKSSYIFLVKKHPLAFESMSYDPVR